jgi:Uma2 family endonuclease
MSAAVLPPVKRYTRDEVYRMLDAGLLEGRFELLDGCIIDKMGQKPPHASTIRRLNRLLGECFGPDRVQAQLPIDVAPGDRDRNEPEPDFAVLREDSSDYASRHPRGDELVLLIEVADTSQRRDKIQKRDLYARAGVPEYWIVDLPARRVLVHRSPGAGAYASTESFGENDTIAPESHPTAAVAISQILP